MLKFYTFTVATASLTSAIRGRYYLCSDGKRFSAFNESTYHRSLMGTTPIEIPEYVSGDQDSLATGLQQYLYMRISTTSVRITATAAAGIANEIVSTLEPASERDMAQRDTHAYKVLLETQMLTRREAINNINDYNVRVAYISRMQEYMERRANRLSQTRGIGRPQAYYKHVMLSERDCKHVLFCRKKLGGLVRDGVRDGVWDDEIKYYAQCLHGFRSYFMGQDFLDKLKDISGGDIDLKVCDCGHIEVTGDTHEVRNDTWCHSCFQDEAVFVEDRDECWPRDDAYYHESDDLYYSYEEESYEEIDDDDDNDEPSNLLSYSTNVLRHVEADASIVSSAFGNFTMGVELEMCSGRSVSMRDAIEDVRYQLGESYCVCKSDGSLPSDGFEIVTAPRGLDEHIRRFKSWEVKSSYRAWNAGTCGLHVHIDSRAFTPMTLGKFLMFINDDNNADFIRSLAGRHPKIDDQARHYCAADSQSMLANPKTAVKGKDSARYRMVNVCNMDRDEMIRLGINHYNFDTSGRKFNTVELRIFRASLKKERLLAQIEFTHAAVMFVRSASYRDLTHGAFKGWLARSYALYPHLAAWYEVAPKKKANPNAVAVMSADETTV